MEMIEVKTAELVGPALDWAVDVATASIFDLHPERTKKVVESILIGNYSPSTDWSQGGPLIEEYGVRVSKNIAPHMGGKDWRADVGARNNGLPCATSPLIAICRAIVAAKLGDIVQIPAELA